MYNVLQTLSSLFLKIYICVYLVKMFTTKRVEKGKTRAKEIFKTYAFSSSIYNLFRDKYFP